MFFENRSKDYYPFGMEQPNRQYTNSQQYRYGYQNQEQDPETNTIFYKYRVADAGIGRFWSVDPLYAKYPYNSQYAFSENRVIDGVELEGLEVVFVHGTLQAGENSVAFTKDVRTQIKKISGNTYEYHYSWQSANNIFNNEMDRLLAGMRLADNIVALRHKAINEGKIDLLKRVLLLLAIAMGEM